MKRTSLVFVALTLLLGGTGGALAATRIKIATLAPENSSWMQEFRAGAAEIKTRTEGRVVFKFYPGGVQGNESKVLRKIQIGQLQGGTFSPTDFQKQFPDLNIYGLPFVFESEDEVDYVRKFLDPQLEAHFEELGFVTFGFASGGFAIVMSNDPVRNQADMRGKNVWLPEGDLISYEAMKALQLAPYTAPITDVLTGLQTGLIDIVAIPPVVALALQWHTKVRYVTPVPVLYVMGFMAIQKKAFDKLDAADQAVVREVMTGIYAMVNAHSREQAANATAALASVGLEMLQVDDSEFAEMRNTAMRTNREMAQRGMFSLQLLEEMQRHIEDYRHGHRAALDGGTP
ncbi:MAG: TRAP transporter substrate-binding protein [Gammaproteobacteria bacterium]|nr:MAG: TRAP transporter substrate-binding protein [Gammaproteobacteria bacterium]